MATADDLVSEGEDFEHEDEIREDLLVERAGGREQ